MGCLVRSTLGMPYWSAWFGIIVTPNQDDLGSNGLLYYYQYKPGSICISHKSGELIMPGDVCSILLPTGLNESVDFLMCVYRNSFQGSKRFVRTDTLAWFVVAKYNGACKFIDTSEPTGFFHLVNRPVLKTNLSDNVRHCKAKFSLLYGTKFYIYRLLLYADDFSPQS